MQNFSFVFTFCLVTFREDILRNPIHDWDIGRDRKLFDKFREDVKKFGFDFEFVVDKDRLELDQESVQHVEPVKHSIRL